MYNFGGGGGLSGPTLLKCMESRIREDAENLIPPVLIFKRSLSVRSTTFPLSQVQTARHMCQTSCQTVRESKQVVTQKWFDLRFLSSTNSSTSYRYGPSFWTW